MALIDVRCVNDHHHEVYRPVSAWPSTPPCPECGAATEQRHLPRRVQWIPDPVIAFQAPDGSMRFPGDASGLSAHRYRQQGFTEIAIRNAAEMRQFERHMNKQQLSLARRQIEARERGHEQILRENRSSLNMMMQSMSRLGREVARVSMDRTNNRPKRYAGDPGFHSDVYANSRSNRDESRDAQGRRRRD